MTEEEKYIKAVEESQKAAHDETMWGKPARDIITGISNNSSVRPVRAIWELVQNARDVVRPGHRAKILFRRTQNELIFQHDGIPFTHKTIEALILQTSSKAIENHVEVGQYGTGFLTTHKFGMRFMLTAPLRTADNYERYYKIENFEIDRHWTDKNEMRKAIEDQWQETQKWGKDISQTSLTPSELTIFRYQHESERARQNAAEAFEEAPEMAPFVMLLNPQIERIAFVDDTKQENVVYGMPEKEGEKVCELQDGMGFKNTIEINHIGEELVKKTLYYIESNEQTEKEPKHPKVTVIMPVVEENGKLRVFRFDKRMPQVFIYLPLLGTEEWGFNFLFHSSLFTCDKDSRDSLRLVGNGQNNDEQAESNRALIDLVNKLIWQFIEKKLSDLQDAKYLLQVDFKIKQPNDELSEYYKRLQKFWREKFETLRVVNNDEGGLSVVSYIKVLDEKLYRYCEEKPVLLDAIYKLLRKTRKWTVPIQQDMLYWSRTLNEWYPEEENQHQLTIDALVKSIEGLKIGDDDLAWLHTICGYLLESKREDLFGRVKLIPNDRLELQYRDQVKKPVSMAAVVRRTLDGMVPEIVETFVHPAFADVVNDNVYDYAQIKDSITTYLNNHNTEQNNCRSEMLRLKKIDMDHPGSTKQFEGERYEDKVYTDDVVQCILDMLKSVLPEDSGSVGGRLIGSFEEFYGITANSPDGRLGKEYGLDERAFYNALIYDSLFKFTLLEDKSEKAGWIKAMVKKVYDNNDSRSFLANYQVYPDQKGVFKYAEWLKKQPDDTPDRALEIYDEIMYAGTNKNVKDDLLSKEYNAFFQGDGVFDTLSHCQEIVAEIALKGFNLTGYEHKSQIVEIIKHFTANSEDAEIWKRLFPEIESNKGQLMFSTLEDQSKKDSLFSLIEIEDAHRLELIAKLAKEPKLQRIYDLGKDALKKEENDEKEMAFKKELGEFVETILKKELDLQIGSDRIKVNNEQHGQDMILYVDGEPTYYIEVKSRWISKESVLMSMQQHRTSIEEKKHYALCVADMVGIPIEDVKEHRYPEFDKVKDRIEVLMNIGELNERLQDATEDNAGKVHVSSGYQVLVSQKVIEQNQAPFDTFMDELKQVVIGKVKV